MATYQQALVKTSVTITETFRVDGAAIDVDSGTPTLTMARPDGTAYTPLPTVLTSWSGRTTGQYRFVVPAQPTCIWLDYTLTGTIGGQAQTLAGRVEWVGAFLFNLDEAKAWDGGAITAAGVSDAAILNKRVEIGDRFERVCNASFYRRFARETHDAGGGDILLDHQRATELVSVKVDGATSAAAGYTLTRGGILRATSNYRAASPIREGIGNVIVEYIHGWDQVPGPIAEAALRVARAQLVPSNIGDRATSITSDAGTILLATAGRGQFQPYGIPLVDAVLADYLDPLAA